MPESPKIGSTLRHNQPETGTSINTVEKTPAKRKLPNDSRIKSPSDTTLYVPALKLVDSSQQGNEVIDKISHFVESICFEQSAKSPISDKRSAGDLRHVINVGVAGADPNPQPGTSNDTRHLGRQNKGLTN